MAQPNPPRAPLCPEGYILKNRWKLVQQIGMGAFGEIYVARTLATDELVAVKVEQVDEKKQALRAEVAVFRKLQGCPCVCSFVSCGRQDEINFLVMDLLGENLSDIRKRQPPPNCCFSLATTARLVCDMTLALEKLHDLGILHRDVKPSNFVLGRKPEQRRKLFVIDFGLSRKFTDANGVIKVPRVNAGFRGTARYASVNSHQSKELSPRDDMWSVFYVAVEFALGTLPWRQVRDRDKVGEMKSQYLTGRRLVDSLPAEFEDFMNHLLTLDYNGRPNYQYIVNIFRALCEREGGSMTGPFEWEKSSGSAPGSQCGSLCGGERPCGVMAHLGGGGAAGTGTPVISGIGVPFKRGAIKPHKIPIGSAIPTAATTTVGGTHAFPIPDDGVDGGSGLGTTPGAGLLLPAASATPDQDRSASGMPNQSAQLLPQMVSALAATQSPAAASSAAAAPGPNTSANHVPLPPPPVGACASTMAAGSAMSGPEHPTPQPPDAGIAPVTEPPVTGRPAATRAHKCHCTLL